MVCIGARGVRVRRHAAHERRHLPRADAAGAGRRHAGARASGPRTSRRRITWRIEKYVSATPGVDHVESISRNNLIDRLRLAQVGHRPQLGADAGAAAGRVRDGGGPEVARRAAAVRPAVRSVERAGRAGRGLRRRAHRAAALRLRAQQHRAAARGHPRRRQRVAQRRAPAADQRRRRSGRARRRAA